MDAFFRSLRHLLTSSLCDNFTETDSLGPSVRSPRHETILLTNHEPMAAKSLVYIPLNQFHVVSLKTALFSLYVCMYVQFSSVHIFQQLYK